MELTEVKEVNKKIDCPFDYYSFETSSDAFLIVELLAV